MRQRGSGVLLHITSLPSPFGIGDLGPGAYRFVDRLAASRQRYWQILPFHPTEVSRYSSPYLATSAFALNPLFISPEDLVVRGYLTAKDFADRSAFAQDRVDFAAATEYKDRLLRRAFERFCATDDTLFRDFCDQQAQWLDDYALFAALRAAFEQRAWCDWPVGLRNREPEALRQAAAQHAPAVAYQRFLQYLVHQQWSALRAYCKAHHVKILGDIPIYVDYDSTDVWTQRDIFKLGPDHKPIVVSGVPPDYFSATGQLWGNPVYRWDVLQAQGYDWWFRRIANLLTLCDVVRIDHFRGFVAFWEVPAGEKTAIRGRWVPAPARDFFGRMTQRFAELPIIAEDLGDIHDDVREMMAEFGFPGMKVLSFAFAGDPAHNIHLPHFHDRHCLVYSGTHDNNPVRGWFEDDATPEEKQLLERYVGRRVTAETVAAEFVRLALGSVADIAILPLQDLLGLNTSARMNKPAVAEGNWQWRATAEQIDQALDERLADATRTFGRG